MSEDDDDSDGGDDDNNVPARTAEPRRERQRVSALTDHLLEILVVTYTPISTRNLVASYTLLSTSVTGNPGSSIQHQCEKAVLFRAKKVFYFGDRPARNRPGCTPLPAPPPPLSLRTLRARSRRSSSLYHDSLRQY
eukprot:110471-Rhodomonas_salina.1